MASDKVLVDTTYGELAEQLDRGIYHMYQMLAPEVVDAIRDVMRDGASPGETEDAVRAEYEQRGLGLPPRYIRAIAEHIKRADAQK